MNVSAISPSSSAASIASLQAWRADQKLTGLNTPKPSNSSRDPAAIKKAASQFEAIILRQLLAPSVEPMMAGSLGGAKGSGGSVYGYMLTDTLANSLAQGGGLGLARILERQLAPKTAAAPAADKGQTGADSHL